MISETIHTYNDQQPEVFATICMTLATEIAAGLPYATSKIWHGAPVWFIDENPVVGYWVRKDTVQLLFWSGQSFDEPGLSTEGKFKAAEARLSHVDEIDRPTLARWLKKAETIQWDYKNIVKRKGKLVRLA